MIVKKKKEGGFINPAYEKLERIMPFVAFLEISKPKFAFADN